MASVPHDIEGLHIGCAQTARGTTGVTVLHFVDGAAAAVDARGGAVSAREHAALAPENAWGELDAIVFAGGSSLGLAAADGVARLIWERRNRPEAADDMPAVVSAVVHDFARRADLDVPDAALGRVALGAAVSGIAPVGAVGAGVSTSVGSYFGAPHAGPGGQGAAFSRAGGIGLLAVCVVNALGNIRDLDGRIVAGCRRGSQGFIDVHDGIMERLGRGRAPSSGGDDAKGENAKGENAKGRKNTTLTAVVTDAALTRSELQRVASMCTAALGRVIDPLHSPEDGDALYVASTGARRVPPALDVGDVGVLAGRLVQQAVLGAVQDEA